MTNSSEKLRGSEGSPESAEAEASEELFKLGLQSIPENIQAILELKKTKQHPEGYDDIVKSDSLENIGEAMEGKNLKDFIHAEGPDLWTHCKLAMTLAQFMPTSQERKNDLKLIMLYHDLGKVGLRDTVQIERIQRKELRKGKLYKVAKGHAFARLKDIEAGFRANGLTGRKLRMFLRIVENHMETKLTEMSGDQLVNLFRNFGVEDEKVKDTAELLAMAMQVDGNACLHVKSGAEGEAMVEFKDNQTWYKSFDDIWNRYSAAK